jgi:transcription elongation factor GreA
MPDPKIPFTRAAFEKMIRRRKELYDLREEVLVRLKAAREMGDLSENGAYRYAKFELGNIGRELRQLNFLIRDGEIRERTTDGTIDFGATITLSGPRGKLTFMLVSEHESDPAQQKLSLASPIGAAFLGKKIGDRVKVETPGGTVEYLIEKVE